MAPEVFDGEEDAAEYSRLTGEDEIGTHKQLSDGLDLISESIRAAGGHVVHYAGDAVLTEFSSVVAALETAVVHATCRICA